MLLAVNHDARRRLRAARDEGCYDRAGASLIGVECIWLFSAHFENTIVFLIDAREPGKIMEPVRKLDYIVAFDKFPETRAWAERPGLREL
jgi:hypothetical protein